MPPPDMGMRPRTVGLSRNQSVPSILSTINGRRVSDVSPPQTSAGLETVSLPKKLETCKGSQATSISLDVCSSRDGKAKKGRHAEHSESRQVISPYEPESSETEGNENPSLHRIRRNRNTSAVFNPPPAASDSEDSDDFGHVLLTRKQNQVANSLDTSGSDDDGFRRGDIRPTKFHSQKSATIENAREAGKESLKSSQASALSQPTSSAGSHLENALGHVRKHRGQQTYRKPKQQPERREKKKANEFKRHDDPDSPTKAKAAFRPPEDSDDSSSSRHQKAILHLGPDSESDLESISKAPVNSIRKRKGSRNATNKERGEKKAKPTFFMPEGSPDRDFGGSPPFKLLQKLSSSSLSDLASIKEEVKTKADASKASTACPWCGKFVRPEVLKAFSKGRRLNVSMQTRFCRSHQKQSARDDWQERGYPDIDWGKLPDRLRRHYDYLLAIVEGQSSYFRNALAKDVRTGKSRTLKQEENLNPGYYGPRGFNLMCDFLSTQFGDLLKEKAVNDRVIAGRGSAAFVQTVLVAELAVELIKEDMGIGEAEARKVFHESKELGEFVHEET